MRPFLFPNTTPQQHMMLLAALCDVGQRPVEWNDVKSSLDWAADFQNLSKRSHRTKFVNSTFALFVAMGFAEFVPETDEKVIILTAAAFDWHNHYCAGDEEEVWQQFRCALLNVWFAQLDISGDPDSGRQQLALAMNISADQPTDDEIDLVNTIYSLLEYFDLFQDKANPAIRNQSDTGFAADVEDGVAIESPAVSDGLAAETIESENSAASDDMLIQPAIHEAEEFNQVEFDAEDEAANDGESDGFTARRRVGRRRRQVQGNDDMVNRLMQISQQSDVLTSSPSIEKSPPPPITPDDKEEVDSPDFGSRRVSRRRSHHEEDISQVEAPKSRRRRFFSRATQDEAIEKEDQEGTRGADHQMQDSVNNDDRLSHQDQQPGGRWRAGRRRQGFFDDNEELPRPARRPTVSGEHDNDEPPAASRTRRNRYRRTVSSNDDEPPRLPRRPTVSQNNNQTLRDGNPLDRVRRRQDVAGDAERGNSYRRTASHPGFGVKGPRAKRQSPQNAESGTDAVPVLPPEPNGKVVSVNLGGIMVRVIVPHEQADHLDLEALHDEASRIAKRILRETAYDTDVLDDLQMLDGIGPKVQEALYNEGVTSFAHLASLSLRELEYIVQERQRVRIVGSTSTWIQQAKLAALGDFEGLRELQSRISHGYLYDDLTAIVGIGVRIQEVLYKARIRSYHDLADASPAYLKRVLRDARLPDLHPDTWCTQAQYIIDDDWIGLQTYQRELHDTPGN